MAVKAFPVEAGQILQFARAIGDPNPAYGDEERVAGPAAAEIVAPPTFTQASQHFEPDFPLRPRPGQPWFGSGREPMGGSPPGSGGGGIGLYAEHRFVYHRHVRPGDVLHTVSRDGKTWEREGRRGGKLCFREYITEFHDRDGALVIESIVVGVTTEKVVGEGAGA